MPTFAALLTELVTAYAGPKHRFARFAGLTASGLSRLLAGAPPPSTDACLRIAQVANVSGSVVLRAAGRGDVAQIIEQLYGTPVRPRAPTLAMTAEERECVRLYLATLRALGPRERNALGCIVELLRPPRRRARRRPDTESAA